MLSMILKGSQVNMPVAAAVFRRPHGWRTKLTLAIIPLLALAFMALTPMEAEANNNFYNDIASAYTAGGLEYSDSCSMCHARFQGQKARGDAAVFYKLFDWAGDTNLQPAFLNSDPFRVGVTNSQKRDAADNLTPYAVGWPLLGFADKDKDGYIRLYYRTLTTGQAMEMDVGTMSNNWPTITPDGWDIDDNDASQGNQAWNNDTPGTTTDSQAPPTITDLRANTLPSAALDFIWTAPGDDPAGGSDETVPVHHYDMRYTTEAIVGAINHSLWGTTPCTPDGITHNQTCDIRNPSHWDDMWNIADCSILAGGGSTGNILFENADWSGGTDGVGSEEDCADDANWNHGVAAPLMRALLEPVPVTPGNNQTFNLAEVTTVVTPGFTNMNQIVDGTTYWIALTSTDGRMTPTGGGGFASTATGFTEPGLSGISNIIAITPGASGAAMQTYSPPSVGDAAPNVTINITGFGLNNITSARLYDGGTIITCPTLANQTATTLDITCNTNGATLGTYDLDLEVSSTLTAAWVDAFEVTSGGGGTQATSATADISPNTVIAGTASQAYTYTITPSGGTADTFVITNPFGSNDDITVTSATINASSATLTNLGSRPGAGDNLDWQYNTGTDELTLLLPSSYLADGWPLVVNFTQSIPTAVSAGNDYSSTFDDSVAAGGVTATTDSDYTVAVDPDAANEWRMVQQPSGSATASVAFGTQPTVELTDQYGNRITTDSTTQVTAAAVLASDGITPGTGTLSGTNPVTISSGLGTFTDLSYDTGEDIQLKFTGGGYTEVNSSTISVTAPAQATSATADISPNTVAAGTASQAYTYTITPSGGSADTFVITNPFGSNDDITVTSATINANPATLTNLGSRPGAGDNLDWDYVAGTDLLTLLLPLSYLENGWPLVVNFTQSIPTAVSAGNDYSSTFDDSVLAGGVTATTDSDYTVAVDPDAANEWRMVQQPSGTATTGIQFGIQPQVELTDQFGNRITTDSTTQVTAAAVLASDGITPGTGTLSGVNPVTISSGLGTFTDLSYDTEEDIDLKFTGGGYTEINSSAISVTAAAAQAGSATADISPNTVTAGTASQAYTYTITPSGGSADTFVITNPFGSNDDITVTSATINANPATLTNAVGRPGAGDNLDWDYVAGTDQLTLLLPSSYLENGWPLVVNFTQSIPTAVSTGNDYSSTFDDSVLAGGVTATTDSDYTVAVDPDAANEWRMVQQPSATGDTGAPFGTQPTVELTDQYGNRITTDSTTQVTAAAVLASDGITPGTGTLSGVNPVTISSGLGTFTDLSYDTIEDIQLKFTGGGHTEVNSSTISMAGQAASATADISPNTVTAGTASQAYTYTITPSGGSADTFVITNPFGSNDDITVTSATINANPATLTNAVGRPGAGDNLDWDYVAGTDQLTLLLPLSYLENGWPLVVNFTQSIPTAVSAGNDYSSTFDDSVLAGGAAATTDSDYTVAVDPDAANEWRMVQQPSASATASVAFTTQPQVELTDQYGNRITTDSTTQVTAAAVLASDGITPGSGTLSGVNPVTISSGLGTFTDLSYDTGEDIQLKFTGGGYTEVNSSTISVGAQASSATADISPNTVAAGTASQAYTYTITPSGGSADTFVITNPFGSNDDISVTSATINANPATLTNAVGRPGAGDNLDWDYVAGTDQLTLLLPLSYLENGWPLVVNFTQSIPTAVSTGNDYSSTFDDSVLAGGVTATTDSDYTVAVDPDAANEWRMVQQPSGTATTGVAFATQPTVELTDQYGNRITTDSTTQVTAAAVLASDGITPGSGTLSGVNPVTISSGLGTFTDLSYDFEEDIQLKFTGGGHTEVNSSTISVTASADNDPPGIPTSFTGTDAGTDVTQVDFTWANPGDGDLAGVMILRNTSSITDEPVQKTNYSVGNVIGTSVVVVRSGVTTSALEDETTIPSDPLTAGVRYYYKAFSFDNVNNYQITGEPEVNTIPYERTLEQGYNMIGLPGEIAGYTADNTFPDDLSYRRVLKWTGSYAIHANTDSFVEGEGYWLLNNTGGSVVVDIDPNSYVAQVTAPVIVSFTTTGWQLIANPCLTNVSGADIEVQLSAPDIPNCGDEFCTFAEAVTGGYVKNSIYRWKGGTYSNSELRNIAAGDNMEPWKSYWLYVFGGSTFVQDIRTTCGSQ